MNEIHIPKARKSRKAERERTILSRKRVQLLGAFFVAAVLPWLVRGFFLDPFQAAGWNALSGNAVAIIIAFWTRYSSLIPGSGVPMSSFRYR